MADEIKDPRIQIDLKLLEDENMKKLEKFSKEFGKNVQQLAKAMNSFSQRKQGVSSAGLSNNASTPSRAQQAILNSGASTAGGGAGNFRFGGSGGGGGGGGTGSGPGSGSGGGGAGSHSNNQQQQQQNQANGIWSRMGKGSHIALGVGAGLGAAAMFNKTVQFATGAEASRWGMNVGESREGYFGTPLGSPAMKYALGQRYGALKDSWFGFNPFWSPKQGLEARNAINDWGWGKESFTIGNSPDIPDWLGGEMRRLNKETGITPKEYMQVFDSALRYGGTDIEKLTTVVDGLNEAAKGAGISVDNFRSGMVAVMTEVQRFGGDPAVAGANFEAITMATGNPEAAAKALIDPQNALIASSMTGTPLWKTLLGKAAPSAYLAYPQMMMKNAMGGLSTQEFAKLRKTNPTEWGRRMDNLALMTRLQPELFGGYNTKQILNMAVEGVDLNKRMDSYSKLKQENPNREEEIPWEKYIRDFGGSDGQKIGRQFTEWRVKAMAKANLGTAEGRMKFRQDEKDKLTSLMANSQQLDRAKAAQVVTLVLDPAARRLLKFKENEKSHSNKDSHGWETAVHAVGTALKYGGSMPGASSWIKELGEMLD